MGNIKSNEYLLVFIEIYFIVVILRAIIQSSIILGTPGCIHYAHHIQ